MLTDLDRATLLTRRDSLTALLIRMEQRGHAAIELAERHTIGADDTPEMTDAQRAAGEVIHLSFDGLLTQLEDVERALRAAP